MQERHSIVVVGEVNPYGADPEFALYFLPRHASGNRLRRILGMTDVEYNEQTLRFNLCRGTWNQRMAIDTAHLLIGSYTRHVFVLLGARVRGAFGFAGAINLAAVPLGDSTVIGIPHPSGLCRAWNVPGTIARVRVIVRAVAPWISCTGEDGFRA